VSHFNENREAHITHEGWINEGGGKIETISTLDPSKASLTLLKNPSAEVIECQKDKDIGVKACCTAYGSGCYVRCCNSCCSDPYGCPGARCCA
jgi:hypothetical protein